MNPFPGVGTGVGWGHARESSGHSAPTAPCTCVACVLALGAAPHTLALLHAALAHPGPAVACPQVLIAGLIEAFLWGPHLESLFSSHHCPLQGPSLPGPVPTPPSGPLTRAAVLAGEGPGAGTVVGPGALGAGAGGPVEAGAGGTGVWSSWGHAGGQGEGLRAWPVCPWLCAPHCLSLLRLLS